MVNTIASITDRDIYHNHNSSIKNNSLAGMFESGLVPTQGKKFSTRDRIYFLKDWFGLLFAFCVIGFPKSVLSNTLERPDVFLDKKFLLTLG